MDLKELLHRIYDGDRDALFENLHQDFVVHTLGNGVVAGDTVGKDGFARHVQAYQDLTDQTFALALEGTVLANETWGLVVHRMTGRRQGKSLDARGFGLWQRGEDGLLTDHWEVAGDPAQWDDFWA